MTNNPYDVLGVDKNASDEQIKASYKHKAGQAHPDRAGGDTDTFKSIVAAYNLLKDEVRKDRYDRHGDSNNINDPDAIIRSQLAQLFFQTLQDESAKGDLVNIVTGKVRQGIEHNTAQLTEANKRIDKFTSLLGRVVNKNRKHSSADLYEGVIQQQIDHSKKSIVTINTFIASGKRMIELLEDYEDTDPDVTHPATCGDMDGYVQFAPGQYARVNY